MKPKIVKGQIWETRNGLHHVYILDVTSHIDYPVKGIVSGNEIPKHYTKEGFTTREFYRDFYPALFNNKEDLDLIKLVGFARIKYLK